MEWEGRFTVTSSPHERRVVSRATGPYTLGKRAKLVPPRPPLERDLARAVQVVGAGRHKVRSVTGHYGECPKEAQTCPCFAIFSMRTMTR